MNLDQLGASFQQNRTAILGTAAAGVVGLALYKRKQGGSTAAAGAATPAAVYSAGGQTAGMNGAAAYDSSASDVYGLVQPQLESLGGQLSDLSAKLNAVPVSGPPAAAGMYSPASTGNYVRYGTGTIAEVEKDGSLLGLTQQQWIPIAAGGGTAQNIDGAQPTIFTTGGNLNARNATVPPTPVPATS